jgi:hypothetical protein
MFHVYLQSFISRDVQSKGSEVIIPFLNSHVKLMAVEVTYISIQVILQQLYEELNRYSYRLEKESCSK